MRADWESLTNADEYGYFGSRRSSGRLDYLHYTVSAAFRTTRSLTNGINRVTIYPQIRNYKKMSDCGMCKLSKRELDGWERMRTITNELGENNEQIDQCSSLYIIYV